MEVSEEIEEILNAHFSDILNDPRKNRLDDIEFVTNKIPYLVSKE